MHETPFVYGDESSYTLYVIRLRARKLALTLCARYHVIRLRARTTHTSTLRDTLVVRLRSKTLTGHKIFQALVRGTTRATIFSTRTVIR